MRVACLALAGLLAGMPAIGTAQWVPNPGEGSVTLSYQYTKITDHLFSVDLDGFVDPATGYAGGPGNRLYMGDVYGQTVDLTLDYGIWRGLAVSADGAYVKSKYKGRAGEGPEDDGLYHGHIQDGSVTLAYMVSWKDVAITPSAGFAFPLSDYSDLGHVAVGSHLRRYPLEVSVGRSLGPLFPRAYASGSFSYTFVQDHDMHSLDQRRFEGSAGYVISQALTFGGGIQHLDVVDGIDWATDITSEDAFHDHDVAAKTRYTRATAFVSYSVRRNVGLRVSYVGTLSGENTHAGRSITLATSWGFRTPFQHSQEP